MPSWFVTEPSTGFDTTRLRLRDGGSAGDHIGALDNFAYLIKSFVVFAVEHPFGGFYTGFSLPLIPTYAGMANGWRV